MPPNLLWGDQAHAALGTGQPSASSTPTVSYALLAGGFPPLLFVRKVLNSRYLASATSAGLPSHFFWGRKWQNVKRLAGDSNKELSLERFRGICLAAPDRRKPRTGAGSCPSMPSSITYWKLLYLGCQRKELPIQRDEKGRREVHHTSVYRVFRRWEADGCFDAIFEGTVLTLHQASLLNVSIIHGDGTTTAAKKGGDNIGFSGHKKIRFPG